MAYLSELIEDAIKNVDGVYHIDDLEIHSDTYGIDVYIGWHTPAFNVGFYPIIQVDDNDGNMILWKEGYEDKSSWYAWIMEILEEYADIKVDDWWYLDRQ